MNEKVLLIRPLTQNILYDYFEAMFPKSISLESVVFSNLEYDYCFVFSSEFNQSLFTCAKKVVFFTNRPKKEWKETPLEIEDACDLELEVASYATIDRFHIVRLGDLFGSICSSDSEVVTCIDDLYRDVNILIKRTESIPVINMAMGLPIEMTSYAWLFPNLLEKRRKNTLISPHITICDTFFYPPELDRVIKLFKYIETQTNFEIFNFYKYFPKDEINIYNVKKLNEIFRKGNIVTVYFSNLPFVNALEETDKFALEFIRIANFIDLMSGKIMCITPPMVKDTNKYNDVNEMHLHVTQKYKEILESCCKKNKNLKYVFLPDHQSISVDRTEYPSFYDSFYELFNRIDKLI